VLLSLRLQPASDKLIVATSSMMIIKAFFFMMISFQFSNTSAQYTHLLGINYNTGAACPVTRLLEKAIVTVLATYDVCVNGHS
jgi:hypothetical protein